MSTAKKGVHPLDPLSGEEILRVAHIVKTERPNDKLAFKAIWLCEPPKAELAPYLDAERTGGELPRKPDRKAEVLLAILEAPWGAAEVIVNLSTGAIDRYSDVPSDQHVAVDGEEMISYEEDLFKSELFKKELAKLKLPDGAVVVADVWIYGADFDTMNGERMIQFLVYMRNPKTNNPNSNHYALPLPLVPRMATSTREVTQVDWVYSGGAEDGMNLTVDPQTACDHLTGNEYDPEQREGKTRDIKPLHVDQPQGASFTTNGHLVEWQDWRFRVGYNFREGLTIHDVSFKGRQLFYRLSFSEMTVPYGDPRPPLHRKQAFDLGDVGAGLTANSLALGCDCLGLIKYFDGFICRRDGSPVHQKNVICMHEQDDGLMWKHTNYRTGHFVAARSRILILQQILTVANYEYIVGWQFDQAGAIHLEVRATGILSTQHIDANKTSPYGTVVHPGVLAAHHQHIFSIRIDPSIDGHKNTVVYDDVVAMPYETAEDKKINPYGTGFTVQRTKITEAGFADAAPQKSRVFKVINESRINKNSQKPVGYKIYIPPTQHILAHPDSIAYKRADFADHHLWVTKYEDQQLFSGGKYTNQSHGKSNGIKSWIKEKAPVENEDVVVWASFGLTHLVRVEDFPIMPSEKMTLSIKPADFFESNPSGDLPVSSQTVNKSKLVEGGEHRQGNIEAEEKFAASHLNGQMNGQTNGHAVNGHTNGTNGTNGCCA